MSSFILDPLLWLAIFIHASEKKEKKNLAPVHHTPISCSYLISCHNLIRSHVWETAFSVHTKLDEESYEILNQDCYALCVCWCICCMSKVKEGIE